MPRFLFTIPHYFSKPEGGKYHGSASGNVAWRSHALRKAVLSLHQTFGQSQCVMQLERRQTEAANGAIRGEVQVVICTAGQHHLLNQAELPSASFQHIACNVPPTQLGYACHEVLQDRIEDADWFCYLEDDLLLGDSMFFEKLRWFVEIVGDDAVLLPNRFEIAGGPHVHRAYIDGDLRSETTAPWCDSTAAGEVQGQALGSQVRFVRPSNPHAGCFFLRRDQMKRWVDQPHFLDCNDAFIGPLESAATLGIMRTFRIYKPATENAGFLEIQHQSQQFIRQLRPK